ncbi:hypothetical protein CPB84DRAFT_1802185 [Gymnopilus junonius]|uniref:Uncharacterized protein n=1 Tax=Gymnopilus junonius TaxID=109634 RepID=A0A9P5N8B2_GYMJU|nr:hypothetical protein CPB84DRAFT_1802185 [Gymnopilus junonius]
MDGYEYDGLGLGFDDDDDENDSWRRSRGWDRVLAERDNLKWPVGEGWKPL